VYIYERASNPTLKKHGFLLGNIEYIYEKASNPTLKRYYVILLN
jgi:hypothetical protein